MIDGKPKRARGLAALREHIPAGDTAGHAEADRMVREQARRETRKLTPSKVEDYLVQSVRDQYAGFGFVQATQTLAKVVFTGDTAGKGVAQYWAERAIKAMRECATPEEAADKIAAEVELHTRRRDTGKRLRLAHGLTELQIRHAEALGEDPLTYVRPIQVTADIEFLRALGEAAMERFEAQEDEHEETVQP